MYYAACCCRPPGVACECGEPTYASLSFYVSTRSVQLENYVRSCITYCDGPDFNAGFRQDARYVQCKVYMKCEPTGNDGRVLYTSGAVDPTKQKFDEASLQILSGGTSSSISQRTRKFRGITTPLCSNAGVDNCCCHPTWQCCDPGSYQTAQGSSALVLPFDPYDLEPGREVSPFANTEVLRGEYIPGSTYQGVPINDDLWYRITRAGLEWNLGSQRDTWKQQSKPDASCEDNYVNQYLETSSSSLDTGALYLIGEECDPHAPGELLVSWPQSENVFIDEEGDNGCAPANPDNQNCPACCSGDPGTVPPFDPPECTFPDPGNKPFSYFWADYSQGGVSGLEFSDEPSPDLP